MKCQSDVIEVQGNQSNSSMENKDWCDTSHRGKYMQAYYFLDTA